MNKYRTSNGKSFTQSQVETRIRKAKAEKLQNQIEEHGFNFCEECKRNANGIWMDCSHDISVKRAKENGNTEQCWNIENITILCRTCHQKKDKLELKFNQHQL